MDAVIVDKFWRNSRSNSRIGRIGLKTHPAPPLHFSSKFPRTRDITARRNSSNSRSNSGFLFSAHAHTGQRSALSSNALVGRIKTSLAF
jgi:hypothetical protein